jgi:hypothetical protein
MKGRLDLSYNFERRSFVTFYSINSYLNGLYYEYPTVSSSTQRLSVKLKAVENKEFNWNTIATLTDMDINKGFPKYFTSEYAVGDINTTKPSFTGGWMNRLSFKKLFFGLDMFYHFSQQQFSPNGSYLSPAQRINSILVQNIFAGYHFRKLVLYIAAKNLYQNKQSVLTDGNRYYGIGFNIAFYK